MAEARETSRKREQGARTLHVRLLGGFRVLLGDRPVEERAWRLRKARSLVKLLALAPGHRLHRERAMDLLWREREPEAAANNLHHALHVARRALGERGYLTLRGGELSLGPGAVEVDVERFEHAVAQARAGREPRLYRRALALYTGELLPEDRYEEWAEDRRESLRTLRRTLLMELAALREERGELREAVAALVEALEEEPANEAAHAALIRVYARIGWFAEAVGQYRRAEQSARRELGIEVGAGVRRVYEEVLEGRHCPKRVPPRTARRSLPTAPTSFVGREREISDLRRLLSERRLVAITGPGGSGKTRLALEVGRRLSEDLKDGACWVELDGIFEERLLPQAVANALGVQERRRRSLTDEIAASLASRKTILLLDNCEHVVEGCARLVRELLGRCSGLRVICASREPLRLPEEVVWNVPPLDPPEAASLFIERARNRRPGFDAGEGESAVREICARLGGIPLAIELAAARVGTLPVAEISARLSDALGLLTTGDRTAPPRQRTLRASLDWSHEPLAEKERALFRRLSVFAGGWSLEAAESVAPGDGLERGEVLDLLAHLVERSLVTCEVSDEARYDMLEPVRQYTREKLEESGEREVVRGRHAAWCLRLAEEAEPELVGGRQEAWLARLDAEHDNLRAALSRLIETGEAETALRLVGALGRYWQVRGYLSEGRQWLEAALEAGEGSAPRRIKALSEATFIGWEQGEFERSIARGRENLALARRTGNRADEALALYDLSMAELHRENLKRAPVLAERAVALRRALKDEAGLARALQAVGLAVMARGDFERAEEAYGEALDLARRAGDLFAEGLALIGFALSALGRGAYGRAREVCSEISALSESMDHRHVTAAVLHILASASGSGGQPVRAARLWGAAEALREIIGASLTPVEVSFYEPHLAAARERLEESAFSMAWEEGRKMEAGEAVEYGLPAEEPDGFFVERRAARIKVLSWASWMAWEQGGDFERAADLGEEGLSLSREIGDEAGVAASLQNLGLTALRMDDLERAEELLKEAIQLRRKLGDGTALAGSLQALGLVYVAKGDFARADSLLEEGLPLARAAKDLYGTVLLLGMGALSALGQKHYARTREHCKEALALAREPELRHGIVFILHASASLAGATGEAERSARLWGAAEAIGETIGVVFTPVEVRHYGPYIEAARKKIGADAFASAWAEGRKMSVEEAIACATEEPEELPAFDLLTPREREVADLVARGLTNRQIAGRLGLSKRTVDNHVGKVLKKLRLGSRKEMQARALGPG